MNNLLDLQDKVTFPWKYWDQWKRLVISNSFTPPQPIIFASASNCLKLAQALKRVKITWPSEHRGRFSWQKSQLAWRRVLLIELHPPLMERSNFGRRCALTVERESFRSGAMASPRLTAFHRRRNWFHDVVDTRYLTRLFSLLDSIDVWRRIKGSATAPRNDQSDVASGTRGTGVQQEDSSRPGRRNWVKDLPRHEDEKQVAVQQDVQVLQEVGAARARTTVRGGIGHGVESVRRGNSFLVSGKWSFRGYFSVTVKYDVQT